MEKAIELGLEVVKFFPAEVNGGLKAIKAMAAPYSTLRFMPTGGINPQNLKEYLNFEKIIAYGGTWMVDDEFVKNHDWQQITLLTKEAIKMMLNIRFHHVGIGGNQNEAKELADSTITNLKVLCCVEGVEYMYEGNASTLHHLCLSTTNIERAMFFLGLKGYTFDQSSIRYNSKGKIEFILMNKLVVVKFI